MKLSVTLTDSRAKSGSINSISQREDYDRVVTETTGPAYVIAGVLRAIADDIDAPLMAVRREMGEVQA